MGLKIVFMGTPEFAVESLERLIINGFDVVAVITSPDKPSGRGMKLQSSPVKQFAVEKGIQILQPEKLKDQEFLERLRAFKADLFVVVAFRMLPIEVWSMPHMGTFNLHASLLPQYRGAAPINHVLLNNETETGVTTFLIDKEIDTGKILFSEKVPIKTTDNAGTLHDKLMLTGADLVVKTVKAIESGDVRPMQQNEVAENMEQLKTAPKLTKEFCRINWAQNSLKIYNFIRGLSPYPAAWTKLENVSEGSHSIMKIYDSEYTLQNHNYIPGSIITDSRSYLQVYTGDGFISIKSLQMEGKKKLQVDEFLRGYHTIGECRFFI
jgi:methionyl-tRNA formyltransferase